ncbi:MAG TPA: hypothetical protein VNU71_13305 [Burkholderiaceae bacterium]|nr:hypothetical protein [Burkholderiaceae bacterium]
MRTDKNSRGWRLYARILREVAGRCTARQLSSRLGLGNNTGYCLMLRLKAQRLVHVTEWVKGSIRGNVVALYALGDAEDAPRPLCVVSGKPPRRVQARPAPTLEVIAFAEVIRAMAEPCTLQMLMEVSGGSQNQVGEFLRLARSIGVAYIGDWMPRLQGGGSPAPMWKFGIDKPNKPRPATQSRRAIEQRYQQGRRQREGMLTVLRALSSNAPEFQQAA